MKNKWFGKCLYWGGNGLCAIGGFAVLLSLFGILFGIPESAPALVVSISLMIAGGLLGSKGNK